ARESQRQEEEERLEREADVAQVLVRFPNGERKGRRFESNTPYDCVDSFGVLETEEYSLITNFPRTVYRRDKESMSLKDAGLHPQTSVFIEIH
ncbi:unnamed protein product, partial [Brassica rapa]